MDFVRSSSRVLLYVLLLLCLAEGLARFGVVWSQQNGRRFEGDSSVAWRLNWSPAETDYTAIDRHHPQMGWVPRPNLRSLNVAGNPVSTNSRGIRDLREFDYSKPSGKKRLLVFGDSFAFGEEVANDETFTFYLQRRLPKWEVINFGVHGYGHDQMLVYLNEEGVKYQPDVVLLGYASIDAPRNELTFRDYAKPFFRFERGSLELTNVPTPSPEDYVDHLRSSSRLLDLSELVIERMRRSEIEFARRMWGRTAAILREFVASARRTGSRAMLVYLPIGRELNSTEPSAHETHFFTLCMRIQAPCHSLRPFFEVEVRIGASFDETGHWKPEAHEVAARGIHRLLTDVTDPPHPEDGEH